MNPRERRLLIALLVVLGVGGGGILVYQWFWKPYREAQTALGKLDLEVQSKEDQIFAVLKERALLEKYRAWSLPPGVDKAAAEYGTFLQVLVSQAKLTDVSFLSPAVTEPRPAAPGQAGKRPGHTLLTFQVRAKGELENLVKALENLRKAPLAHRVKSLTLDRVDVTSTSPNPKLNVALVLEALIVSKVDGRTDNLLGQSPAFVAFDTLAALERGPTGLAFLPWVVGPLGPIAQKQRLKELGDRNYADIAKKNIFAGAPPPRRPAEEEPDPFAGIEITDYVKLDTTDVSGKQAFLRNYLIKSAPMRVRAVPQSGYDTFRVTTEDRGKTLLRAKVLRVDQRDVYFQVGEDVYGVHIGQSLADAMRRPLSITTLDDLELTALYDEEWAEEEMEAKQGKTSKSKTTRKGPQKKGGKGR